MSSSNKRPSLTLSLFINNISESSKSPNSTKSPRVSQPNPVGLGIVAAMNHTTHPQHPFSSSRVAKPVASSKSDPIPIVFSKPKDPIAQKQPQVDDESYTCVISHVGNSVKKREYFGDDKNFGSNGVFFTSPLKNSGAPPPVFDGVDFLSNCYLCRRRLHGRDIFMYRGEKAFCSAECRCQQIVSDERKAKCGSGALKSFDCSISPCSAPSVFTAGVAAA